MKMIMKNGSHKKDINRLGGRHRHKLQNIARLGRMMSIYVISNA